MLTEGREQTGERNVDWKKRADRREECLLEDQSGMESGSLTGGTEDSAEGNVD